jgi:hypothetical protein
MGEAKRRAAAEEDAGKEIFRAPDMTLWGTPEGLKSTWLREGQELSDEDAKGLSALLQPMWKLADGLECGKVLGGLSSVLIMVFSCMARGDATGQAYFARLFAAKLVATADQLADRDEELRQAAQARRDAAGRKSS